MVYVTELVVDDDVDVVRVILGGQWKTATDRQFKTGHHARAAETSEFYFVPFSARKSVCSFVRQLRGPHLRTCA
jgi:hypothetical protein